MCQEKVYTLINILSGAHDVRHYDGVEHQDASARRFISPPPRAAHIAVQAVLEETGSAESVLQRVIFYCFGDESRRLHEETLVALGPSR